MALSYVPSLQVGLTPSQISPVDIVTISPIRLWGCLQIHYLSRHSSSQTHSTNFFFLLLLLVDPIPKYCNELCEQPLRIIKS